MSRDLYPVLPLLWSIADMGSEWQETLMMLWIMPGPFGGERGKAIRPYRDPLVIWEDSYTREHRGYKDAQDDCRDQCTD
jgi:hypothetical protein